MQKCFNKSRPHWDELRATTKMEALYDQRPQVSFSGIAKLALFKEMMKAAQQQVPRTKQHEEVEIACPEQLLGKFYKAHQQTCDLYAAEIHTAEQHM